MLMVTTLFSKMNKKKKKLKLKVGSGSSSRSKRKNRGGSPMEEEGQDKDLMVSPQSPPPPPELEITSPGGEGSTPDSLLASPEGALDDLSPGSTASSASSRKMWSKKKKAGTETWFGSSADEIPYRKLGPLERDLFATYSGPDRGLSIISDDERDKENNRDGASPWIAGARAWNIKSRKAYGICLSLYDQHPVNGKITGDPIADSFGICARKNNALLIVADGVNWGEKSKMAARCAVYGCMKYMNEELFGEGVKPLKNTQDAITMLLKSFTAAHMMILEKEAGLTTLCAALIAPLKDCKQYAVMCVNVGDSFAYIVSKHHGIREITTGSHDIQSVRDIRDAGGALGPVRGREPELHNLTCSLTLCDPGDIVFLASDGISDNFDPVVTKIAVAREPPLATPEEDLEEETPPTENGDTAAAAAENVESSDNVENGESSKTANNNLPSPAVSDKPDMEPHERHHYAVKEMERLIHEFELYTEQPCSAQELCGAIVQHVLKLTDQKRKVLENPNLYGKKLRSKERKKRDSEIVQKMGAAPGKLDHASIVSYEVGVYHGNDDEDYEATEEELLESLENAQTSPMRQISFESTV